MIPPKFLATCASFLFCLPVPAADPPNVVLILDDDLAIGDLSYFNNGLTRTPRLDRLLAESVYFDHAYSGSPVCAPSRAPFKSPPFTLNLPPEEKAIAEYLDELG